MAVVSNGTTIADAGAFSVSLGSMVLLKTTTVSSNTATVSFIHGTGGVVFNNTYPIYLVKIINSHNDTDDKTLRYNFTTDGSNFNVTKTTTSFRATHYEAGGGDGEAIEIRTNADLAQSTNFQGLNLGSSDNDHAISGTLNLFNPSSTTFVKHFILNNNGCFSNDISINIFAAGYGNTTSAVDAVQFKMSSGNIDAGTITLYGIN